VAVRRRLDAAQHRSAGHRHADRLLWARRVCGPDGVPPAVGRSCHGVTPLLKLMGAAHIVNRITPPPCRETHMVTFGMAFYSGGGLWQAFKQREFAGWLFIRLCDYPGVLAFGNGFIKGPGRLNGGLKSHFFPGRNMSHVVCRMVHGSPEICF